eukprot:CAMPEP_0197019064 /NCGR_PEP_ID=MMETSP1380-20130617/80472_1 /TAXON_ID=5936 /ORGANISM="Euplotes crassus, Strain CT5" /LENGTH=43 /DNA_ID= /DNA_START= /DNA_END= /DNA_ORIENTATION=
MISISEDDGISEKEAFQHFFAEIMILFGRIQLGPNLVNVRGSS